MGERTLGFLPGVDAAWMWQALASPASCAACTAIAERSPNAQ